MNKTILKVLASLVFLYLAIVLSNWLIDKKLVFNIFKSNAGLALIGIAVVMVLLLFLRDTANKKDD